MTVLRVHLGHTFQPSIVLTVHTWTDFVRLDAITSDVHTVYAGAIDSGLCTFTKHSLFLPSALGFYTPRHQRTPHASVIALLLLLGGVQQNPGPSTHVAGDINFGSLNVRSAVNKSALIHFIIADHHLDILALSETWIAQDAPLAIKADICTIRFLHSSCSSRDSTRRTNTGRQSGDHAP